MPVEIERKFLLAEPPDWSHAVLAGGQRTDFEQVYLRVSDTVEERIRRRAYDGAVSYEHAILSRIRTGVREVDEREIDATEYDRLRATRDPRRGVVRKERVGFHWQGQFFELDIIHEPATRACHLLEVEIDSEDQEVVLPDFLSIDREVTKDPSYSNAQIALG